MAIYRKGQNQFELHESARLGQNKLALNRKNAMDYMDELNYKDPSEVTLNDAVKMGESVNFLREDISRQASHGAALDDITVGQHKLANNMLNAVAEMSGLNEDVSIPISGDDLARGAAGKKVLEQLDFD